MHPLFLRSCRLVSLGTVVASLSVVVAAQGKGASSTGAQQVGSSASRPYAKRTPWGHPDLHGLWTNTTTTPLERPAETANKTTLTDAERAELDRQDVGFFDRGSKGTVGAYNDFWFERGLRTKQTSLIIDPPSGRLPPLTPTGEAHKKALAAVRDRVQSGHRPAQSWEDFSPYDRCITRAMPGAMTPGFYNHNYEIVQTPQYVAIYVEMLHDVRIIPVDGRPHLAPGVRQWLGDSRGPWEGGTLGG